MKNKIEKFKYGKLSKKALDFFMNSDAFINIAHGSVRSSKTITATMRWIQYIMRSPHSVFLMTGKTRDTIDRNVIKDMMAMLEGEVEYTYNKFDGVLKVENKTIYVVGLNDEGATSRVQGMTCGGWYADEATTSPKSAIDMCISRCSLPGSKIFWTLNPDSPYHFIYTEYLKNKELRDEGIVKDWHFTLDDNKNLTKEYITNLKKIYSSSEVLYKRYIEGLWVIAEGIIYTGFNTKENVFTEKPYKHLDEINISSDYGVSHATVFSVIGIEYNPEGNKYYLLEEQYHSGEETGIYQTDGDRVDTIAKLLNKYDINTLFLSHDASSLQAECERDPRINVDIQKYSPDVYNDINTINNLFKQNRFLVHADCINTIRQLQTYAWDAKAAVKGREVPLKVDDDAVDAFRAGICGVAKKKSIQGAIIEI